MQRFSKTSYLMEKVYVPLTAQGSKTIINKDAVKKALLGVHFFYFGQYWSNRRTINRNA